jgi:hypothetical protein
MIFRSTKWSAQELGTRRYFDGSAFALSARGAIDPFLLAHHKTALNGVRISTPFLF